MRNYKVKYWNQGEFKTEYVSNCKDSEDCQARFHVRMKKRNVGKCLISSVDFVSNSARLPANESAKKIKSQERELARLTSILSQVYKMSLWSKKQYFKEYRDKMMQVTEPFCGEANRLME